MKRSDIVGRLTAGGVIPVVRCSTADAARRCVAELAAGGIDPIEVTMTVPGALELIKDLAGEYGDDLLIGAGTVTDARTADECIEAGAKFIVSPGTDLGVIERCKAAGIAVMPGALTPTEVMKAWAAGPDLIKVFPASAVGGPGYLRSLKGPFPQVRMIPTGGVTLANAGDFIRAGAEAVGVGSDLVNEQAIEGIADMARRWLDAVAEARTRF